MPLFYYLPKVHKDPIKPPGRPIIAGIGSLTSGLSQYIYLHLQKHVIQLDLYLKDTSSVIGEVTKLKWQPGYKCATLNVTALFSNIPREKGIAAVNYYLSLDDTMPERQKRFILEGINFILKHNVLEFNGSG